MGVRSEVRAQRGYHDRIVFVPTVPLEVEVEAVDEGLDKGPLADIGGIRVAV